MGLDYNTIYSALQQIVPPGGVFELRLFGARKGQIDSGYFDNPAVAASALCSIEGWYEGIYLTPNPVVPDAAARSYNRISSWVKYSTSDTEIARRRWVLIDIDPKRLKGISSNDAEHEIAHLKAISISRDLSVFHGWPTPMMNDSGNGYHLLYPIDEENSDDVRDEIHTFLRILQKQYNDDTCEVDVTVYNAARIFRLPGTYARKGDSTAERPHRIARVVQQADPFKRVSIVQILKYNATFADLLTATQQQKPTTSINRQEYPDDEVLYKRLNNHAMNHLSKWVPHFFPTAREYKQGYRVASADIGQSFEEELAIHPWPLGIKYFGPSDQGDRTEGRRTPVGLIAQYSTQSDKATAARMLGDVLSFPVSELDALPPPTQNTVVEPPVMQPMTAGYSGGGGMELLTGQKRKYNFKVIRTVADLQKESFTETKWVVQNVVPIGNMLLASRPKMRKTWLALQLSMAIATGGKFLDWQCNKGDVLFLGLEDNRRRIRNRINTLQKFEIIPRDLSNFRYWTGGMDYDGAGHLKVMNPEEQAELLSAFPRGEAGVDAIEQFLEEYPNTSTVIIDTLAHFRGERTSRDIYQSDYDSMIPLTKLAARKQVLIIPVHHEKKGNADRGIGGDFLEDVSGSAGITGGSDGVIAIKGRRGVQDEAESRKLLVSGRDVPFDYEVDIAFDTDRGGWVKAAKEDTRVAVRAILARHPFLSQVDLRALMPTVSVSRLTRVLTEMLMEGEVDRGRFGYSLKKAN